VVPSKFAETLDKSCCTPQEYALATAHEKGREVYRRLSVRRFLTFSAHKNPVVLSLTAISVTPLERLFIESESPSRVPDVVIAADTVVVLNGEVLEKPRDSQDALAMLQRLNGKTHRVCTGLVLVHPNDAGEYTTVGHVEETEVEFRRCGDEVYRRYVETGEPLDKAGGSDHRLKKDQQIG
jgi:predicted house-cleaning NTP pyrophosphatase (Maf/HAM1 superfamily)